ncbi:hypothetical protein EGY29_09325 [Pseudomonas aeruginosa]|nr:hypothetical protein EGY29_09325 [Pseudomonas aeruginosa]KSM57164.1 hypothetical protein APA74_25155 [Pseudomonas aeruginosa]KSO56667.1 hypothetical protein APA97_23610 [Pseudomonas aeruginosa]ORE58561.1 hypothetical protein B1H17_13115 [Pseudomonas aeruginosa]OXZ07136.1 hypothetical protein ACG87_04480 [Pseudomonas aeruginosa]
MIAVRYSNFGRGNYIPSHSYNFESIFIKPEVFLILVLFDYFFRCLLQTALADFTKAYRLALTSGLTTVKVERYLYIKIFLFFDLLQIGVFGKHIFK